MAISTEKLLHASERFMLVKMTPGRYIVDDLSADGGGEYSMSFPFPHLSAVKRNGTSLSLVTTLTANDQYTWDGSTLTVKIAAAPDEDTNVLVAFYDLYFTGSQARYAPDDPESAESAGNPLRQWEPRIKKYPNVNQTIRNITEGILSYSNTSINLINEDDYFDQYLTIKDSFNNKDIKIWQCINTISNIKLVYAGKVKDISSSRSMITFSVYDPFTKFSQDAYFKDPDYEAFFLDIAYPNLVPSDSGNPCPYWTARSAYKLNVVFVSGPVSLINFIEGSKATCIGYDKDAAATTSNNRSYALCRVGPNGLKVLDFGTTVRQTSYSSNARLYKITDGNLKVGDQFTHGGNYFMVVYSGDDFTYSGSDYNTVVIDSEPAALGPFTLPPTDLSVVVPDETPPILFTEGLNASGSYLTTFSWGHEYTWGFLTTEGGNKIITVNLSSGTSSPEYNKFVSGTVLDPTSGALQYVVDPADTFTHGEFIERLCDDAGISVNSASITAADSALAANVSMSIPNIGESSYRPMSGYVQDVLKSTLGYLTINSDFEAEYNLIETPASDGEQIDDNLILKDSLSERINYQDIKTSIIAKNPHYPVELGDDEYTRSSSAKSKYLHQVENTFELNHVLDDISVRLDDILAVKSARVKRYSFDVATQLIDSIIGDDITLSDRSANVKIIDIKKDGSKVSIEADDLGEL